MFRRSQQSKIASCIGVEITPTALRAVEVRLHGRQMIVERLAQVETPEDSVLNGRVTDPAMVGSALRRLWDLGGFSMRRCVVALPAGKLTPQMLTLPPAPPKEQRLIVRGELERFAPIEENTPFGWLSMTAGGGPGGNTLAFLGESELVTGYQQAFAAAGIEADACEPDALAALRALHLGLPQTDAVAAVFVSDTCSEMAFLEAGGARYYRRLDIGIGEIADGGAAEGEDADLARFLASEEQAASARRSDSTEMCPLSLEIKRSIQYFARAYQDAPQPQKLLLVGDHPVLERMAPVVQSELCLATECVHPAPQFAHAAPVADDLLNSGGRFSVALGAALRPTADTRAGAAMDLRARVENKELIRHAPRYLMTSLAGSTALVVVTLMGSMLLNTRLGEVKNRLDAADTELKLANAQREAAVAQAEKARVETARLRKEALPIPDLLTDLGGKVPGSLAMTNLQLQENGTLVLEGEARTPQQVNVFLQRLSDDPEFLAPNLESLDAGSQAGATRFKVQTGLVGYEKKKPKQ